MKTPATLEVMTSARTSASYSPDTAIGQIFSALAAGESLTSLEALRRFGSSRLAAVVLQIKKDGHPINSEMVEERKANGTTAHVARYWMTGAA